MISFTPYPPSNATVVSLKPDVLVGPELPPVEGLRGERLRRLHAVPYVVEASAPLEVGGGRLFGRTTATTGRDAALGAAPAHPDCQAGRGDTAHEGLLAGA